MLPVKAETALNSNVNFASQKMQVQQNSLKMKTAESYRSQKGTDIPWDKKQHLFFAHL